MKIKDNYNLTQDVELKIQYNSETNQWKGQIYVFNSYEYTFINMFNLIGNSLEEILEGYNQWLEMER